MKFVLIKKQELEKKNFNIESNAFFDDEFKEVMETVDIDLLKELIKIPPETININIKGKYFTEILLRTLTPAYLRGTKITVNGLEFKQCTSNPQYFYTWQEKVPNTLPEYLKTAYRNMNLRGDLYQELVEWNEKRIQLAIEKSKFKWELAEDFYKELFKRLKLLGIKVNSPNKKTFFEATAELTVENYLPQEKPLTEEETLFLAKADVFNYIKAFGLQDTILRIGLKHRTTPNGTTEEPYIISDYDVEMSVTAQSFNRKTGREAEGYLNNEGFLVKEWNSTLTSLAVSHRKERENIETLKWFLSLNKETQKEFLLPGWHFCPVCGRLYYETEGCYNNDICHVPSVEMVPYNENHDVEE